MNPNDNDSIGPFCGPENINLDNPQNNERFAVGVRFYNQSGTTKPDVHADVYCDGARILAAGYDPIAGNDFPQLVTPGQTGPDSGEGGDMWKVGLVTTSVSGGVLTCNVVPTPSKVPDPTRDGSTAYCVDDATLNGQLAGLSHVRRRRCPRPPTRSATTDREHGPSSRATIP